MNNQQLACYYSVVRFCPYPETDEFVNVGVVLSCPSLGFLDFKHSRRRVARVSDFFPELDPRVFHAAIGSLHDTLVVHQQVSATQQLLTEDEVRRCRDAFFALVRPRETILFFSEHRVILSQSPAATLAELYSAYVDRRFAQVAEYQEGQMCRRLEALLRSHKLLDGFQLNKVVGDEHYRVNFPFVRFDAAGVRAERAIKALYLDKEDSTDIIRHADNWRGVVRRLRDFKTAPDSLLFVMHPPSPGKSAQRDAFDRVMADYGSDHIPVTLEEQSQSVLTFARP